MLGRRLFLAGSGATWLSSAGHLHAKQPSADADLAARIRVLLAPFVTARDFSGLVAIQGPDGPPLLETFGFADRRTQTPITASMRFGIESISKLLTVQALRALKGRGQLATSDPLAKYIPDFPNAHAITIAMLAQHTSGISRDLSPDDLDYSIPHSTSQLVEIVKRTKPAGAPGASSNYSNNGYLVLATVIELASGMSYSEVLQGLVLDPLGMSQTEELSMGNHAAVIATPYQPGWAWGSVQTPPPRNMTNYRGAASFASSAADLLKLAKSLPGEGPTAAPSKQREHVGHDGRGHGYVSVMYNYPAEQTAMVVLGNIESGLFDSLRPALEAVVFDRALPTLKAPQPTPGDAPISPELLGKYDLFGTPLLLGVDDRRRYFVDAGDGRQPLIAIGPDTLFSRLRYATLRKTTADNEPVLAWSEPSGAFTLKRLR